VNTDDLWPDLHEAESQVLRIQAKLHQWATDSPVGSVTYTTSCPIPPSFWWRGIGCGTIVEHDRPGWTESNQNYLRSDPVSGEQGDGAAHDFRIPSNTSTYAWAIASTLKRPRTES
jgi:hypothetical protein